MSPDLFASGEEVIDFLSLMGWNGVEVLLEESPVVGVLGIVVSELMIAVGVSNYEFKNVHFKLKWG